MQSLRVAVSGAQGFIGAKLVPALQGAGYEVWPIVRKVGGGSNAIFYDYDKKIIDKVKLATCYAVIHLAGKNINGGVWTTSFKKELYDSRVKSTRFLSHSLAELNDGPKILLNASAIGIYGDRSDQKLDEDALPGQGFLADLCIDWERGTLFAKKAGLRVVNMRISPVLDGGGGIIAALSPLIKLGLGATIKDRTQYFSYIARDELVNQILFILSKPSIEGPVNMVSFQPTTFKDFLEALGRILHRPVFLTLPKFLMHLLGEQGKSMLASSRVYPKKLIDNGYPFTNNTIEDVLKKVF